MTADKNEKEAIELDFLSKLTEEARDVIVWMLKSAASNPLMGYMAGLIILDMMHQAQIISDTAYAAGMITLGAFDAIAVATAVKELTAGSVDFLGLISATSTAPGFDVFAPTATTVTYADTETPAHVKPEQFDKLKSLLPLVSKLKALPP